VLPNLAQYKNGRRRKGGADFVRFVLFDNKALQIDDAFAPCVNSYFVNYKNNMIPVSNLMFTEQVSGITVDNRQVPSTVEGVITQGKLGAPPANNVQAGISHNHMIPDTWTMIGTVNDLSTGGSNVTTGELRNMPIGRVVACDKLVNTFTGWITAVTGEKTLKFTYTLTFSGTDVKGPMRVQVTYDPTDPACVNGCQVSAGFLPALAPCRLSTRAKAWFNGSLLGTFNVGTQDGVDIVLGTADEVAFVDDDTPDMVFRIKSNIGGGALFTENNVPVVADGPAYIDPFEWGDKLYMGSGFNAYPISGPSRDLAGIVLRSDVYYSFEFGAPL
jgi:metal-sulfur cluster biosynthetic enzyme